MHKPESVQEIKRHVKFSQIDHQRQKKWSNLNLEEFKNLSNWFHSSSKPQRESEGGTKLSKYLNNIREIENVVVHEGDKRTKRLMNMHKSLRPRCEINRRYVTKKEGGRQLTISEDCVNGVYQGLKNI